MPLLLIGVSLLFSLKTCSRQATIDAATVASVAASRCDLVDCWDVCFDTSSLTQIDEAGRARAHSFTSVFDRRSKARSPLESAIQSILDELDEHVESCSDFFVEYWWRDPQRIQSLEAHRDVDEGLCKKIQTPLMLGSDARVGIQRCPNFGHVLYVGVENMIAPTLVFQEEESDGKSHLSGGPPRKLTTLWSVPACSNRLLRFRGDGLHAVNYPPLQWLKDYESDDDSSHLLSPNSHQRRAVLLFNTWEKPPLYPPVGESLVVLGEKKLNKTGSSETKCRPKSLWAETPKVVPKEMNEHKDLVTLNVPLLGDFSRRACNETFLALKVDGQKATAAFVSTSFIHQVKLIQEPWRKLGDMHE